MNYTDLYFINRISNKNFDVNSSYKREFIDNILSSKKPSGLETKSACVFKKNRDGIIITITTVMKFVLPQESKELIKASFATEFHILNSDLIFSGLHQESANFMRHLFFVAQTNAQGIFANELERKKLPVTPIQFVPVDSYKQTIIDFLNAHKGDSI